MPRTVPIPPLPVPPPVAPTRRPRRYGPLGVALLVVAALAFGGHYLVAGASDHSYDRGTLPPRAVAVTVGTTYFVSTRDGPGVAVAPTPLRCTYQTSGGQQAVLSVTAIGPDSRATHAVASFVAPVSGTIAVTCSGSAVGSRPVFVDDADDAGHDLSGVLLLIGVIATVAGGGALLGVGYRRREWAHRHAPDARVATRR